MKYGALTYKAQNYGDDIQTIAAMRFLPKCDYFVNRDDIQNEKRKVKIIGNAYWDKGLGEIPDNIKMLPISMHLNNRTINLDWLIKNQPIGCRDTATMEFLHKKGIKAYFSGCLTLTLPEYRGKRENRILLVDCPDDVTRESETVLDNIKFPKGAEVVKVSPRYSMPYDIIDKPEERLKEAEKLLDLYRTSRLVISRRIHAVFPCVGMGTPVVLVRIPKNRKRTSGYDFIPEVNKIDFRKNYTVPRPVKIIKRLEREVDKFINANTQDHTHNMGWTRRVSLR